MGFVSCVVMHRNLFCRRNRHSELRTRDWISERFGESSTGQVTIKQSPDLKAGCSFSGPVYCFLLVMLALGSQLLTMARDGPSEELHPLSGQKDRATPLPSLRILESVSVSSSEIS